MKTIQLVDKQGVMKYQGVVDFEDDPTKALVIDFTTDTGDLIQIDDNNGVCWTVSNGMNGYGENIFDQIKDLEVKIIDGPFSEKIGEELDLNIHNTVENCKNQEESRRKDFLKPQIEVDEFNQQDPGDEQQPPMMGMCY